MSTRQVHAPRKSARRALECIFTLSALFLILVLAIIFPGTLSAYVKEGFGVAAERVIPTTFPFMIISAFAECSLHPESVPLLTRLFAALLGIPECGVTPVIVGNIAGFPVGAKMVSSLYERGLLEKGSAEKLLAYADNPSPAFVVGVAGGALFGDVKIGIMLLICIYLSTLLSAQCFREKRGNIENKAVIYEQKFNFIASVKSAALASITLSGFIVIFYVISKIIRALPIPTPISLTVIAVLEVTAAVSSFAREFATIPILGVALSGFSLAFGGISVFARVGAFAAPAKLSTLRYLAIKALSGLIAAIISTLGYMIIK